MGFVALVHPLPSMASLIPFLAFTPRALLYELLGLLMPPPPWVCFPWSSTCSNHSAPSFSFPAHHINPGSLGCKLKQKGQCVGSQNLGKIER